MYKSKDNEITMILTCIQINKNVGYIRKSTHLFLFVTLEAIWYDIAKCSTYISSPGPCHRQPEITPSNKHPLSTHPSPVTLSGFIISIVFYDCVFEMCHHLVRVRSILGFHFGKMYLKKK